MAPLLNTIANRPYVMAIVIVFWILAPAEIGVRRALVWFASGTLLGWLFEWSSTRTGFPFGHYAYHPHQFPGELWIGGVPPFASVSFAALTYCGYSAAVAMLAPLRRVGGDVVAFPTTGLRRSAGVLALAALIPTWLDMVVDPVTHLGRYWLLGDLYHYEQPGAHFDVPLVNYLGWLVTCATIVLVNQRLGPAVGERPALPARNTLPLQPLWGVGTIIGNLLFVLGVTVWLMISPVVPDGTPLVAMLVSGLTLSAGFVALATWLVRRGFHRPLPSA